jgi:hypothetical protein
LVEIVFTTAGKDWDVSITVMSPPEKFGTKASWAAAGSAGKIASSAAGARNLSKFPKPDPGCFIFCVFPILRLPEISGRPFASCPPFFIGRPTAYPEFKPQDGRARPSARFEDANDAKHICRLVPVFRATDYALPRAI